MQLRPQTRFLMRGSSLLVGLLSLWWFLLLPPMTSALKAASSVFLTIQEAATGDWTLRVPMEGTIPASPEQPVPQRIHSVDFDLARGDVIAFTFSLPVFWAVMLAAPGLRRSLRPLVLGTAVMAVLELAMLLVFSQIAAQNAATQLIGGGAAGKWLRHVGEYMVVSVLPYALPFVVALGVHGALREAVFEWTQGALATAAPTPAPAGPPRTSKKKRS